MPQYLALIHFDMQLQFSALVSSSFLMYFSWVLPLELCIELCIELSKVFQNCQATGTGPGPGPGMGYWDWGWESGIGNWEWEMGKWKMEMGKWEIESTPSPRR